MRAGSLLFLLLCLLLPRCASTPALPDSQNECIMVGGAWESLAEIYPAWQVRASDRHICNLPAKDAGKVCNSLTDCSGVCLAPEGSRVGQRTSGRCSSRMLVPQDVLLISGGLVADPNKLQ